MAVSIVHESKIRQMPVCNGLETLLCHRGAAQTVLPSVLKDLHEAGVEIRGCPIDLRHLLRRRSGIGGGLGRGIPGADPGGAGGGFDG